MARGLHNWTFKDVISFLKDHNFSLSKYGKGSHYIHYVNQDKKYTVEVNRIPKNKSYPIRTLETMIQNSGLPKEEWRKWASS